MPGQRRQSLEGGTDDVHGEVPTAVAGPLVADVVVAVVAQFQVPGRQDGERRAHLLQPELGQVHGSAIRSGRTSTDA